MARAKKVADSKPGARPRAFDRPWAWPAVVAFWPYLFLAGYTIVGLEFGNDFRVLYYDFKLYLLSMLATGHFPLWSPSEGAGYSFVANPFVGALFPLNAVYLAWYTASGGLTTWDYMLMTVGSLALFALGIYFWLRSLGTTRPISGVCAMLAATSMKMTEMLRFPNAVHAAACIPWLLYGLTLAADGSRIRRGAAAICAAVLCLLTAGYPYYAVYALILAIPYGLVLLFPAGRRALMKQEPEHPSTPLDFIGSSVGAAAAATALALPWLSKARELMALTVDRGRPNFDYATAHVFDHVDTLGSWIFPPASQAEGWYYFGMAVTLSVGAWAVCQFGGPGSTTSSRDRSLLALVGGWIALVSWFSWGKHSLLFRLVWEHAPVLNQMRVWGRMNVILVPAIALLLARALEHWCALAASTDSSAPRELRRARGAVAAVAALALAAQLALLAGGVRDPYWEQYIVFARVFREKLLPYEVLYPFFTLGAAATLLWLLGKPRTLSPALLPAAILAAVGGLSAVELVFPANGQWTSGRSREKRTPLDTPALLSAGLQAPRALGSPMIIGPRFPRWGAGVWENWGLGHHVTFRRNYLDPDGNPKPSVSPAQSAAVTRLYGAAPQAERFFFSRALTQPDPASFIADVDTLAASARPSGELLHFDGDRIRLRVTLPEPAWLTYVDNWAPGWRASIDSAPAQLERLFGTFKSVRVPAGTHDVRFEYRPW